MKCDRCDKKIDGFRTETFTAGFYDVTGYWAEYANPYEKIICDECMWKSEKYQGDYGGVPVSC